LRDGLRVLAVIPARGGSDTVPYLNIKRLGDKPLLAHTLDAARASSIDRVIVSTDDPRVAEAAAAAGADVPFVRPASLARDLPSLKPVIVHAVTEVERAGGPFDLVVVLQATSPFRGAAEIEEALTRLLAGGFDAVVSVTEDRTLNWREQDGALVPLFAREGRRDEQTPLYKENGAVVAMRRAVVDAASRFGEKVGPRCWTSAPASRCTTSRTSGWPSGCCARPACCSARTGARAWAWATCSARWPSRTCCAGTRARRSRS
jgi:CMP-N-acetylneuraminic acid synthetase